MLIAALHGNVCMPAFISNISFFFLFSAERTLIPIVVGKLDPRDTPKYIPSAQYFITQFLCSTKKDAEFMQLWLALQGAKFIKLDHTFKVASKVRGQSGEQQWVSVFSIMNEHCQVLGQFACSSKSLSEVQEPMAELMSRLEALSLPVRVIFVCCAHDVSIQDLEGYDYLYLDTFDW